MKKLLVGLIGAGIQKSMSPALHEEEARHHGLRLHYQLIDLHEPDAALKMLPTLITAVRAMGFAGLNITYPCKQAVIPLLDDLSEEARAVGAVNTIVCRDGRLTGHNTDSSGWAWGFRRALPGASLARVVLLGAGGAGSAIGHAALRIGVRHLAVVDSDSSRATALAKELERSYGAGRASAAAGAESALADASGLINATPVGMEKHPGLPLDERLLHKGIWVSEVVYVPLETALLRAARRIGCPVADGGHMNVGQAFGAFQLFTGFEPDAARMEKHFRSLVSSG